jgi:hypothetical protein
MFNYRSSNGFQGINPFLTPSDVAGVPTGNCTGATSACLDLIALFSSLAPSPRSTPGELRMIGSTDRRVGKLADKRLHCWPLVVGCGAQ